jgi:drug/metabolite transporter (DMT)-like permease
LFVNLILFIAILVVSWATIFVRWCGDTPASVIALYRMLWSFLLFATVLKFEFRPPLKESSLTKRDKIILPSSGILLAFHFITWISSLQLTTIAHSLMIYSTQPVFAIILSPLLLREKVSIRSIVAILITLAGVFMITGYDFRIEKTQFLGGLLALLSAFFVTLYIFLARYFRNKIRLLPYVTLVYGSATITLFIYNVVYGFNMISYPLKIHFFMLLLALIPTGIGHSLLNWIARNMEVYKVNLASLGEFVFASILAYIFFSEKPEEIFYIGAVLVSGGILFSVIEKRSTTDSKM